MASLALRNKSKTLNLKPHQNLLAFSHHYSSSSSSNNDNDGNVPPKPSSFTSYFNQQPETSSTSFRASNYNPQGSKPTSFDEIKKSLSEFRRRSGPETPLPATQKPISFQNRFNKIGGNPNPNPNPNFPKGGALSFEKIKESLKTMRVNGDGQGKRVTGQFSLNNLTESFKTKPSIENRVINFGNSGNNSGNGGASVNKSWVIGGSLENLPKETFGKEIKEKEAKKNGENDPSQFELIKVYSLAELGMKLKELRPDTTTLVKKAKKGKDGAEEGWFSLSELQQRLGKLKEIEERESARSGNAGIGDLRRSLVNMKLAKDEKPKNARFDILSQSSFMVSPPKEHLVEKYFHPDNMSAAEKLKLELKKVRDEFKMSESDCGSTRVQIAQLTTEILHLSSVLHKKDKHSRRGLQAKVQQRKKLLKYLRRTDWDSYCFVLSKLGLRDNPDYKN